MIGWALSICAAALAAWRRRRGCYDRRTLGLYWWAWRCSSDPVQLLRLAWCRRDFGHALPTRWRSSLEALCLSKVLSVGDRGRLAELLAAGRGGDDEAMAQARSRFASWLKERAGSAGMSAPTRVCVAGNAGSLRGAGRGHLIDAHPVVIRFNQWQGPTVSATDVGQSVDVWVMSPNYRGPVPSGVSWVVVTGPEPTMALERWPIPRALRLAGVTVLTVPLPVWRGLVARLDAPPSAGVLTLAWLAQLCPGWSGVACEGLSLIHI